MIKHSLAATLLYTHSLLAATALPTLEAIESWINQGQFSQTYQQLKPHEFDISGDSDYDYWFGLAALESGHAEAATIAFERVLMIEPDFLGARLDLARAYYQLNNLDYAKQQFNDLLELAPPDDVKSIINEYLTAINQSQTTQPSSAKTQIQRMVSISVGADSNVNNSTNQSRIFVAGLGSNVTLSDDSTQLESGFLKSNFNFSVNHQLNKAFNIYNHSYFEHTELSDFSNLETSEFTNRSGTQFTTKSSAYRFDVDLDVLYLDGYHYRDAATLTLNWDYNLTSTQQLNSFAQINYLRYVDTDNESNNSDLSLFGINWIYQFNTRNFLSLGLFAGDDNDTDARLDGQSKVSGFRITTQQQLHPKIDGFFSINFQRNRYDRNNPLFDTTRDDKAYGAQLGFKLYSSNQWLFQPSIDYYNNQSNIAINDYERVEVKFALSRSF